MIAFFQPFIAAASSSLSRSEQEALFAILVPFYIVYFSFVLALVVLRCFFLMRLYAKANVPAWKAWVPFVNTWKFFELGGYPGALSLLYLAAVIPCIGFVGTIIAAVYFYMAAYQISLKNGKDGVWVVLFIFLPVVWEGIMGLGKSVWNDCLGKPALGPERPPSWPPYGGMPSSGSYYGGSYYGGTPTQTQASMPQQAPPPMPTQTPAPPGNTLPPPGRGF